MKIDTLGLNPLTLFIRKQKGNTPALLYEFGMHKSDRAVLPSVVNLF